MNSQRAWMNGIWVAAVIALMLASSGMARAEEKAGDHPKKMSWKKADMHSTLEEYVDRAVAKSLSDGQMSGCVVLVGRKQGIVLEKAYGNRCTEPNKEQM